jgi:hypothetical protein
MLKCLKGENEVVDINNNITYIAIGGVLKTISGKHNETIFKKLVKKESQEKTNTKKDNDVIVEVLIFFC